MPEKRYLTKSKVLQGINLEKEIPVRGYGNMYIKFHPISDAQLTAIQEKLDYGIMEVLDALDTLGLTKDEIDKLLEGTPQDVSKLKNQRMPANLVKFLGEVCRYGIIPENDPDCPACHGDTLPNGKFCSICDIRNDIDKFRGFSTMEIGAAILGISIGDWQAVEDFFSLKMEQSGQEPSA